MSERKFTIFGDHVPPMLGRVGVMQRMLGALTKVTPDHLQVVGPRSAGKTVVLHELAHRLRKGGSPYAAVLLWDLGHQTPGTDELFMQRMARELSVVLAPNHAAYAGVLENANRNPYHDIVEVLDALKGERQKVLAIMDGFDKPLMSGKLTRNLWDQLRELASRPSLRLVTASRRRLHELIRSPDSQTSDFWNIFNPSPVLVSSFDDGDIDATMALVTATAFGQGARTELVNWSGGFPPLFLSLLNGIQASMKSCDASDVNQAAEVVTDELGAVLSQMWADCPESSKDLFCAISEARELDANTASPSDLTPLFELGFVKRAGQKLVPCCRFIERYLTNQGSNSGSMARLFGSPAAYNINTRSLLERRIAHLTCVDATLKRYIARGIEDLPDNPEVCLANIRGIIDKALDLIWNAELPNQRIPSEWFDVWKRAGEKGPSDWDEQFPRRRGQQIRLLQLMTGTDRSAARARFVSKNTYVLANAAQTFGDFGQHLDGAKVDVGAAFAALNVCVELAAALERELK